MKFLKNYVEAMSKKYEAAYNPKGAWNHKPFGFKDLEGPVYHDQGRLIDTPTIKVEEISDYPIDELLKVADQFKKNLSSAKEKGATVVSFGKLSQYLFSVFNASCIDTEDKLEDYKKSKKSI